MYDVLERLLYSYLAIGFCFAAVYFGCAMAFEKTKRAAPLSALFMWIAYPYVLYKIAKEDKENE